MVINTTQSYFFKIFSQIILQFNKKRLLLYALKNKMYGGLGEWLKPAVC